MNKMIRLIIWHNYQSVKRRSHTKNLRKKKLNKNIKQNKIIKSNNNGKNKCFNQFEEQAKKNK